MIPSTEFSLRNSLYSRPFFKKLLIQTDLLPTLIEVAEVGEAMCIHVWCLQRHWRWCCWLSSSDLVAAGQAKNSLLPASPWHLPRVCYPALPQGCVWELVESRDCVSRLCANSWGHKWWNTFLLDKCVSISPTLRFFFCKRRTITLVSELWWLN